MPEKAKEKRIPVKSPGNKNPLLAPHDGVHLAHMKSSRAANIRSDFLFSVLLVIAFLQTASASSVLQASRYTILMICPQLFIPTTLSLCASIGDDYVAI